MSSSQPVRLVIASQLSLYLYLFICFLLLPKFLLESNEGGVSNYGVHALTIVPYTLAFLTSGVLLLLAARSLDRKPANRMWKRILVLLAILTLLVLATTYPYKLNQFYDNLHVWSAILLFLTEMAAGVWLVIRMKKNLLAWGLFVVQFAGFALSFLTLIHLLHILFLAQLINNFGFSALLVYGIAQTKHLE